MLLSPPRAGWGKLGNKRASNHYRHTTTSQQQQQNQVTKAIITLINIIIMNRFLVFFVFSLWLLA